MCHSVQECGYATVYRAEDRQTREIVRLAVCSSTATTSPLREDHCTTHPGLPEGEGLANLEKLVAIGKGLPRSAGIIDAGGLDGPRVWAASPWVEGTSLADLVLHHGRFPPEVVLEIARAMLGELVALEAAGLVHGDIRVQNVLIANDGEVHIPHPGLRGVIRPQEGISYHDLVPDACSTLAPERVTDGTPPTVASDLFACGCVWWHILCGRPPLGGGDTLARLRAAQAAAIDDLHQWAADVPDVLVAAIGDCLQKDPQRRPKSMADLAAAAWPLAPPRSPGNRPLPGRRGTASRSLAAIEANSSEEAAHPHRFTAAALALLAAVAVAWPLWVAHNRPLAAGSGERAAAGRIASSETAGRENFLVLLTLRVMNPSRGA